MIFRLPLKLFAGLTTAMLCLVFVTSNEATAQIFRQRANSYGYYNPYGGGYNSGYYGGRGYGYNGYGYDGYGYDGYGQGSYQYRSPGIGLFLNLTPSRRGTYYHGTSFRQRRTGFGHGSRYYSPYGNGWRN